MSSGGVLVHLLEVNVANFNKSKLVEKTPKRDPCICIEYGNTKFQTDGGGYSPDKFTFFLEEGVQELNISICTGDALPTDGLTIKGSIQLHTVLSQGHDEIIWPVYYECGSVLGELHLLLRCYLNPEHLPANFSSSLLQNVPCSLYHPANYQSTPVNVHAMTYPPSEFPPCYPPGPMSNVAHTTRGFKRTYRESSRDDEEGKMMTPTRRRVTIEAGHDYSQPLESATNIEVDHNLQDLTDRTSEVDCMMDDTEMIDEDCMAQPVCSGLWDTICF